MAGTINSLNEDRSRLAWRVRHAGVPSEIIDELINDNIVALCAAFPALPAGSAGQRYDDHHQRGG
jgi:hypothetical protein